MRRHLVFAFTFTLAAYLPAAAQPKTVEWNNHYDEAVTLAQKSGKPMLIEFWASWCGPCKQMDHDTWADARVADRSQKYVSIAVDADRDIGPKARFLVKEIPTIIIADPWGEVLFREVDYEPPAAVLKLMDRVPADFNEVREWREQIDHGSKEATPLYKVGQFYEKNQIFDLSNVYYERALKNTDVKNSAGLRQDLELSVGFNHFRNGNLAEAGKTLQRFLKDHPGAVREDEAMMGLVMVQLKQGKQADAQKSFETLKAAHPASRASDTAARLLAQGKALQ